MGKLIRFYPATSQQIDIPGPHPARLSMPEHYRSIPAPARTKPIFGGDNNPVLNVRACVPYQDALAAGYIQSTWCDLYIDTNSDDVEYHYSRGEPPLMWHRSMHESFQNVHKDYLPVEFLWNAWWQPETPPGYSVLITHPLNRTDLPFMTTSGIVDSDVFVLEGSGQVPFYIRRGFSGLIPAGTPMYQVIPIYRHSWKSHIESEPAQSGTWAALHRFFTGGYRRQYWQRKHYD